MKLYQVTIKSRETRDGIPVVEMTIRFFSENNETAATDAIHYATNGTILGVEISELFETANQPAQWEV